MHAHSLSTSSPIRRRSSSSSSSSRTKARSQKRFWCILDADIRARNEREAAREFLRLYGIHSAHVQDVLVEGV